MYVCICVCMCAGMCFCMRVCMFISMHVCMCVFMCVCMWFKDVVASYVIFKHISGSLVLFLSYGLSSLIIWFDLTLMNLIHTN